MRRDITIVAGTRGDPTAVLLPGTGSRARFVTRAFAPALVRAGYALVTADPEPGRRVVTAAFETLDEASRRYDVRLVGGISLGAHVAVRWAAAQRGPVRDRLVGLLLALPAWTGAPGAVAAAGAHTAAEVRRAGMAAVLAEARRHAVGWVADELDRAWPGYGAALAETLDAAARSAGPRPAELARIRVPVGIAAFTDDPLHPLPVATEWAATLRHAVLRTLSLHDCAPSADGPEALGTTALAAWHGAARHRHGHPPAPQR